jgi:hypothetical protein
VASLNGRFLLLCRCRTCGGEPTCVRDCAGVRNARTAARAGAPWSRRHSACDERVCVCVRGAQMSAFMGRIRSGEQVPVGALEEDTMEYSDGYFSVVLATPIKWE